MNLFQFMSDSPILTFFIVFLFCEMVTEVFKALTKDKDGE